ncbi:MAG: undecaprenyldiphospho-muramoylpentapeptide beta-N-acetylglucosaminyltransferase [Firmicutes bacterium]|nr:undecaprenyldiphospho-muramoylpentapeptide beta-N-acetylglucosaminyltransferase [Bacillota bacterium]
MKIIISAGGTGGHIYPAIGIINKFKEKEKNLEVLYIGTHNRMEKDIIPALNIPYEAIEIYGFSKTQIFRDIKDIFLIKKAYDKCKRIMQEFKPDVVIGVGGYVTMPVIAAAKSLEIPTVIHEQNSIPGKTNKFLSKNIDLACVSYENSTKYFSAAKKVVYTGNPCGENALTTKKIAKETLGLKKDKKLLLMVAGSLGSETINNYFTKFLSLINETDNFEVVYITGKSYYEDFVKGKSFSSSVKVLPFLDNLSGLFGDVDLIISRAGAGTISEILAMEIPSILIPSPYVANNHQYYNALDLKNKNVSILLEEKDLNAEDLYKKVCNLMKKENNEYQMMKENLSKLDMKHASTLVYESIKEILK